MNLKNNENILNEIQYKKNAFAQKVNEAIPQMFFMLGILVGFVLNIAASIIFELIRSYKWIQVGVLLLTVLFILVCLNLVRKFYIKPLKIFEREIEALEILNAETNKKS